MSRTVPYSPMGQKVCNTTSEEMFEKLHARVARTKAGPSAQPKSTADLDRELLLASRLRQHNAMDAFDGLTTMEQRRDRMRAAILSNALSQVFAGKRNGKPTVFAELFELTYGESL